MAIAKIKGTLDTAYQEETGTIRKREKQLEG
jgi:hypothetical protein